LGVTLATMSRALNNKTDVGYNEVNDWLNRLGIEIDGSKIKSTKATQKIYDDLILVLNDNVMNDKDKYIKVMSHLQQIAEKSKKYHWIYLLPHPKLINNRTWQSLYSGWLVYINKSIYNLNKHYPYKLSKPWSPYEWHGTHSEYDKTMKKYNVIMPQDELRWI
jgi:hypothetical protein